MAFLQPIAFDVDAATGSDTNGGGFDATSGTPGTNYAWGAGQTVIAYTDLATTGAVAIVTSITRAFIAADVGNVIKVSAGTNFTTGRYQIISVAAGAATLDRVVASGVGSGGTGRLGGALATMQEGVNAALINAGAVADCRVYIKKGASAYASTLALTTSGAISPVKSATKILGYFSAHDDDPTVASGNQPVYAVGSGAGVNGYTAAAFGITLMNVTFDGTATSGTKGTKGAQLSLSDNHVFNCKFVNFSQEGGVASQGDSAFINCEFKGCAGTIAAVNASGNLTGGNSQVKNCWIHQCTQSGIAVGGSGSACGNLITNCTGATTDGITGDIYGAIIDGNTIYGMGRDGIRANAVVYDQHLVASIQNNILAKNGGFGLNFSVAGASPLRAPRIDYNAYYGNASGTVNNVNQGAHDVIVSINPFNSSDANLAAETAPDWGLNNTAAAGAALRGAGFPGNLTGLTTTTGYRDIGLFQHQDAGGAATFNRALILVDGVGLTTAYRG